MAQTFLAVYITNPHITSDFCYHLPIYQFLHVVKNVNMSLLCYMESNLQEKQGEFCIL